MSIFAHHHTLFRPVKVRQKCETLQKKPKLAKKYTASAEKSTPLPVMSNIRCAREAGCNEGREELMGEVLVWRKLDESQFSNNRDHFCGKLVCERLINNNAHSFPSRIQYIFYRTQVRSLSVTKCSC